MYAPHLGDLQSVLVSAARCLDCADSRCMNVGPKHIAVRAAMRLIVDRGNARPSAWMQRVDEATASAIEAAFENI